MKRAILVLLLFTFLKVSAQTPKNRVIFMPFENKSPIENKSEFNWIGEAIAKGLADLLGDSKEVSSLSIEVVSNEERKIAQQQLRISLTSLPSIASSLKVARETASSMLVIGEYNIFPAKEQTDATISVKAIIIEVDKGKILGSDEGLGDNSILLSEALTKLQQLQGKLAYRIFLRISGSVGTFPFSEMDFIRKVTNRVPPKAFEAYIKGLLSNQTELRENYLKNALRIYAEREDPSDKIYADAAIELGYLYMAQSRLQEAIRYFSLIPQDSSRYPESSFHIGLIYWQQKNYEQALAALRSAAEKLQMIKVHNFLGAVAIQASLAEKKDKRKSAALLNEGIEYLKNAVASDPENTEILFNYGIALFLNKDFAQAIENLEKVLVSNPNDGEVCFVLAKAFQEIGNKERAFELDDQARRLLRNYARLENTWTKNKNLEIPLRTSQVSREELAVVISEKRNKLPEKKAVNEIEIFLQQARSLYKEGRDDEAMQVLRRVLVSEPMTAEAYLLIGNIYLRRGEMNQAVSNFRTAIFWDNRLIEAYIALTKIAIEFKNCLEAENWLKSALEISPQNEEVIALQRQVERCSK
ncbi:MAG: tetratricopeptide repeat protein [Acidobacteriota bacterium]|nr:tetratricopeptide repeat protein [Pyrinomonadaceae bacterium]MDW8303488.1 tetratricopeptide repeat protein [Acidobacteriota bacterium]